MRKEKQKTWHALKDDKCPKCGADLQKGMFDSEHTSCPNNCGFTIKDETKDLLVTRDYENSI